MRNESSAEYPVMANGGDDVLGLGDTAGGPSLGAYAQVAALLHESRREAPDQLGAFLRRRVAVSGCADLSVFVTDFEQRRLLPIAGSAATASIDMDASTGGRSFTTGGQVEEPVDGGTIHISSHRGSGRRSVMVFGLTLTIEDADVLTDEAQEALFEAGCDDATFGISDGVQTADFDGEAADFAEAVASAINSVETAVPGARVVELRRDRDVAAAAG